MKRMFGLMVIAATVLAAGPDLNACGDKSLSAGGIRMMRAAAARAPASVLAYVPPNSQMAAATRELKLQKWVGAVGHRYHEVASLSELRTSIATGQFNIVVADLGQVADLERSLGQSSSRVVLVPLAYKLTKAETRAAQKQRRFLITERSRVNEYLGTIHDAVRIGSASSRKA
jgi:hypothetical protein